MDNTIEVVKKSLEGQQNVSPAILENVPIYVKRAVMKLQRDGIIPPEIVEYNAEEAKEERRDGNGNLLYNFIFLPDDFRVLDRLVIHKKGGEKDNKDTNPYQHVSNDSFFHRRRDSDSRNFFSIIDYNIDDERPRKILALDPYPDDQDYVEIRYRVDGTEENLNKYGDRYWESIIATVEEMLGLRSRVDTEDVVLDEVSDMKNQEGQNSYNKTFKKTKVRFPFGKR